MAQHFYKQLYSFVYSSQNIASLDLLNNGKKREKSKLGSCGDDFNFDFIVPLGAI